MTTGQTTALTRQTFVGKAMSLNFNILSRLVFSSKELLLLRRFSHVRLSATLETAAHQAPVPGIHQARILEWVAISFSNA